MKSLYDPLDTVFLAVVVKVEQHGLDVRGAAVTVKSPQPSAVVGCRVKQCVNSRGRRGLDPSIITAWGQEVWSQREAWSRFEAESRCPDCCCALQGFWPKTFCCQNRMSTSVTARVWDCHSEENVLFCVPQAAVSSLCSCCWEWRTWQKICKHIRQLFSYLLLYLFYMVLLFLSR